MIANQQKFLRVLFVLAGMIATVYAHAEVEMPFGSEFEHGVILLEKDKYAEAAAVFDAIVAGGGPLAPYANVRLGDALANLGKTKEAEAAYVKTFYQSFPGPWKRYAASRLAALYDKAGRHEEARTLYERVMDIPYTPWWYESIENAAALNAITIPHHAGEGFDRFIEIYRTSIFPAKRIEAARMLLQSGRMDDRLIAIVGLAREGEHDDAAGAMKAVASIAKDDEVLMEYLSFIQGAIRLKGIDGVTPATSFADPPDGIWARWCMVSLMSMYGAREDWASCEFIADTMIRVWPGSHETVEALWRHGYWLREKEQHAEAAKAFARVGSAFPLHRRADDAMFEAGVQYEEAGDSDRAVGAYEALADRHPQSRLTSEAYMRLVDLLSEDANKAGMIAALEKGAAGPIGQYHTHRLVAMRAKSEGGALLHELPPSIETIIAAPIIDLDPEAPLPDEILNDPRYKRMAFFGSAGLIEGEWEALDIMYEPLDGAWKENRFRAMADSGHVHSATEFLAHEGWGLDGGRSLPKRLRVFWGRPHWPLVQELAKEFDIDPYLILAVGRQESTFRPALTSWAGASGLMQVMPSTAKWLADVDPAISEEDVARLEDPRKSLRLGALYIRRMLNFWDGKIVHALASYNAGPGNARKWDKANDSSDLAQWIEQIPFHETNNYVKRVLGNYAAYHTLYPENPQNTPAEAAR